MTISATTITELNDLAKDFYSNVLQDLPNTETVLKSQFDRLQNAAFTGRKWIFAIKDNVGGGSGNAGANKTLPNPTQGTYDQGDANVVRTYTSMAIDGLVMEVTKRREGSYRPALAEVMADRVAAQDLEVQRQLFCAGDGKLAITGTDVAPATATGAGATQDLTRDYGVVNGGPGTRHVYAGDQVAFYQSNGTLIGRRTVSSVDHVNSQITVASTVTSTNSGYISKSTDDTDNKTEGEALGLLTSVTAAGHAGGANYHSIPAATTKFRSYVASNSAVLRTLTDPLILEVLETVRSRSREMPNLAVTTPGVILRFSEQFLPLRRLDGQDVQLKGGYKPAAVIVHGGGSIPVIGDVDCPANRLFLLNTGAFRMADLIGSEWADMDGAIFDRVSEKDQITGYLRKYWQLITVKRSANAVIEDLQDVTTIQRQF